MTQPPPSADEPARLLTDANGFLADVNLEACLMLDMGRRALIGKRLSTFVDRADLARLNRLLADVAKPRAGSERRSGRERELVLRMRDRVGRVKRVRIEGVMPASGTQVTWNVRPLVLAA